VILRAALFDARQRLIAAGIEAGEAVLDVELLARHALGWDRATLVARLADAAPGGFEDRFGPLVDRRIRREPMAYILGVQEFWGRDFVVGPGVLIPRPETELLVEEALAWARELGSPESFRIVDVGTGSGCLAVTLALELRHATVAATDVSTAALAVAAENARRLDAAVQFRQGSLLADIPGPLDLIVSNPPYVTRADYTALQPEVRQFEPESALVGGADGLDVIRAMLPPAAAALRPAGRLLVEIGHDQAAAVSRLVSETRGIELVRLRADLRGIPRAIVAERRAGR
jgi:release factor glutamine methyltransferase